MEAQLTMVIGNATKVIEIPAEPADPDLLPPLLKGFKAVPPFVTVS